MDNAHVEITHFKQGLPLGTAPCQTGSPIITLLSACHIHARVHGRATRTRMVWPCAVHVHVNDVRVRLVTNRACAWLLTARARCY